MKLTALTLRIDCTEPDRIAAGLCLRPGSSALATYTTLEFVDHFCAEKALGRNVHISRIGDVAVPNAERRFGCLDQSMDEGKASADWMLSLSKTPSRSSEARPWVGGGML